METNRSFIVFSTEALSSGHVSDETFLEHATSLLRDLRGRLIARGWKWSEPEPHSFYAVKMSAASTSGRAVQALLQVADEWLLILSRNPTLFERLMGRRNDNVPTDLVEAVIAELVKMKAANIVQFTRVEFEKRAPRDGMSPG